MISASRDCGGTSITGKAKNANESKKSRAVNIMHEKIKPLM